MKNRTFAQGTTDWDNNLALAFADGGRLSAHDNDARFIGMAALGNGQLGID